MVATTDSSNPRYVVGVDFGTTYTSVAFAHSASPDEVKLVETWPKGSTGGGTSDQVPTELYYSDPITRKKTWGYEAAKPSKGVDVLKWFKLLLQGSGHGYSTISTPAHKSANVLAKLKITVVQVVADFLTSIREVTIESIERTYGAEWVQKSVIEYVLTVPAIWSDAAKDLMVQAAMQAGFGVHRKNFHLVSEPEAAAAYSLSVIPPNSLKIGDTFVICDAGGGTVDLISYKITGVNPLKIVESVSGSGDLCGSVYLDQRFEEYIRAVLGDNAIDDMKLKSKTEMMRTWEAKVKFIYGHADSEDDYFEVTVPGVPDCEDTGVEDGFYTMDNYEVKRIFDPIIERIISLVEKQVLDVERKGDRVAAVLLVGGFGSSEYLLHRLQDSKLGRVRASQIEILQPVNARSAIVRGALLRGLDGSIVKERRSRRYYGTMGSVHYVPGVMKGCENHTYYDDVSRVTRVTQGLSWGIKRNQVIVQETSASVSYTRKVAVRPQGHYTKADFQFVDELVACDLDNAPEYQWQNPSVVHHVCYLSSDLSKIRTSRFPILKDCSGNSFYSVSFDLRLSMENEVLKFELLFDGKALGMVTAKFE